MYVLAKDKPFFVTLNVLNMFFWYPINHEKTHEKWFYICSLLLRTISLLSALGTLVHLVLAIKDNTNIELSEDIGDLTGFIGCMLVCPNILFTNAKWSELFNKLLDFKQFGKPPNYDKIVKRGNLISLISMMYATQGMLWYCFVTYIQAPECRRMNTEKNLREHCGMVNPTWLPFKQVQGATFYACYLFQLIGIFVYLPPSFATCMIPWEAVEIIVARLNHLKGLFKDVFNPQNRKLYKKRLRYCISYHQDIIKISEELNVLVKATMGKVFITAAVVIGSLGRQVLQESTPKAVSFIMGYIIGMFFLCHAGQRLIDESLNLTEYVYDSRWYEIDPEIKRDVVFVLARCQKPIHLTTPASMGSLGYFLFSIMIKTSYSYLTLLNQMVS
uniref:Odorant receptor n=1 Tax=Eucryptorrhynchus scrobiculatus TaxID=1552824 RepID=A0A8F4RQ59_EUCSC|nr:odorant receptor 49 [Eucryptorrhynchus scrobiculatus]